MGISLMSIRLNKEFATLQEEFIVSTSMVDNNAYKWKVSIKGPAGSPYQGGIFDLIVNIPESYPHENPNIKFKTRIYHINISPMNGKFCEKLLSTDWSPSCSILGLIKQVYRIMSQPDPSNAAEPAVGAQFTANKQAYNDKAASWCRKYANK